MNEKNVTPAPVCETPFKNEVSSPAKIVGGKAVEVVTGSEALPDGTVVSVVSEKGTQDKGQNDKASSQAGLQAIINNPCLKTPNSPDFTGLVGDK